MNVIIPNIEYAGEVWEGNAKLVKLVKRLGTNSTDHGSYKNT